MSERIVIGAVLLLALLKAWLAAMLPLHGDEAFYWWESLRPALGYSDLPPMTAWLLALTVVGEGSYLGARWAFLLLGTLLPVAVYLLALEFWPRRLAWLIAAVSLGLPLVALQGLLALPDVLINLLGVLLAWSLVRALNGRSLAWLAVGTIIAAGFLTHPRFVVPALAATLVVLGTATGRACLRGAGPWYAAVIALTGVLPTLVFNLKNAGVMLAFQLDDRHPWRFQPEGLAQPLVQALVTTPVLYVVLVTVAIALLRHVDGSGWKHDRWRALAFFGLVPPLFYFVFGLFADQERVGFHWPLVGYLALLAGIPLLLDRPLWRRVTALGTGLGFAIGISLLAALAALERAPERDWPLAKLLPTNLLGWPAVAARVPEQPGVLVADNFMLAAQLAFELGRAEVFSLDHPRNVKHGRAAQLAIWGFDEASLPRTPGVLVVEETALSLADRPAWARKLCAAFPDAELEDELSLLAGRRRFRVFTVGEGGGPCDHPSFGYIDAPRDGANVSGTFEVSGWAFDEDLGVGEIEVLLDGEPAASASERTPREDVAVFFGGVADPDRPMLGFSARVVDARPGVRRLSLRLTGNDGRVRETVAQEIRVR